MPTRPNRLRPRGQPRPEDQSRAYDERRGSARARGYTAEWDRARRLHLLDHPLCVYCEHGAFGQGQRVVAAVLVDHLYPHHIDPTLFWARQWWASCCKPCHDGPKQAAEHQGLDALHALARRVGFPPMSIDTEKATSTVRFPLTPGPA